MMTLPIFIHVLRVYFVIGIYELHVYYESMGMF